MSYFTAVTQGLSVSTNNSSTTNLAVGNSYTFTGTADATLGFSAVRVNFFADKNCTVSIQQSTTLGSPNWDVVDNYTYFANTTFGINVSVITTYYRVVVTTASLTTTVFRLQSVLTPIANPLPRSLDAFGNMKVSVRSTFDNYGNELEFTPTGEMRVAPVIRLTGSAFDLNGNAGAVDPNFWVSNVTNSGTVVQANGQATLDTAVTAANGAARMYSFRRARFVPGTTNFFRANLIISTAPIAHFTARWGVAYGSTMPTLLDGAWFQMSGLTFSVVTKRANAADNVITTFNGNLGAVYTPPVTTLNEYEIYYGDGIIRWTVNGELLHTYTVTTGSAMATAALYQYFDVANSGALQTSNTMVLVEGSVNRLGQPNTVPHYGKVTTANTYNFKYGSGLLHSINVNSGSAGTLMTVYDDTTGTANVIAVIQATAGQGSFYMPHQLTYNLGFYNGLKIVSTGTWDVTVIYE